jgi:predicted Zn-dependent protease
MAHNLARHQGEKVSSSVVVNIIAYLSLFIDPSGSFLTLVIPAAKLLGELPNSRLQESEADQIGMRLAAEACYDPEALSHVFRRMDTAGKKGIDKNLADTPPEFLSTHPSDDTRIKDMQKWLPEDNKIFNMYGGERCRAFRRELQSCTIHDRSSRQSKRENMASTELPCWK